MQFSRAAQANLKVSYSNANGIKGKEHELQLFLKEQNIDIMLIGETWLRNSDNFKIPNYQIYRTDRTQQPRGETAVCILKWIQHLRVDTVDSQIENTAVKVVQAGNENYLITASYCSPNRKIKTQDLKALLDPQQKIVLMGDLNAKHRQWECHTTNTSGTAL